VLGQATIRSLWELTAALKIRATQPPGRVLGVATRASGTPPGLEGLISVRNWRFPVLDTQVVLVTGQYSFIEQPSPLVRGRWVLDAIGTLKHVTEQLLAGGAIILAVVLLNLYLKSRATR
jgi:hypothetical protein